MNTVAFPGDRFHAVPPFACTVDDDWEASETGSAWMALAPAGHDGVSVLVSSTRVDASVSLRDMAVRSFARQRRSHPAMTLDSQRVGRFGDRVAYVRAVTVPISASESLSQIHAIFFAPTDAECTVADVFTLVGTCPIDDIETYGPQFVDLIASFEFTS